MQTGAVTWTCGGRLSRMQTALRISASRPHVFADLSKNLWDRDSEALLLDLARATGLEAHRNAMFAGEAINTTENRAVLHTLLRRACGCGSARRCARNSSAPGRCAQHAERDAGLCRRGAQRYRHHRCGEHRYWRFRPGPHMAVRALEEFRIPSKRFHFVSNVDGHELHHVLQGLKAENTLFIIASRRSPRPRP